MAAQKARELRDDERRERNIQRCIESAVAALGRSKSICYRGKLGTQIRLNEAEAFFRNSNADSEAVESFVRDKVQQGLRLLFEHYGRKNDPDLTSALFGLVLDLAYDHVPAFQIEQRRGRPSPKRHEEQPWNSPEAIKAAFRRAGIRVARRRTKGESFSSKDPLHEQHPLQLVSTVNQAMALTGARGRGAAIRAIEGILAAEAQSLGKPTFKYIQRHSKNIQKLYSTWKPLFRRSVRKRSFKNE